MSKIPKFVHRELDALFGGKPVPAKPAPANPTRPSVEEVARELVETIRFEGCAHAAPQSESSLTHCDDCATAALVAFADRRVREELERAAKVLDMHNAHSAERVRRLAAEHADTEEEQG